MNCLNLILIPTWIQVIVEFSKACWIRKKYLSQVLVRCLPEIENWNRHSPVPDPSFLKNRGNQKFVAGICVFEEGVSHSNDMIWRKDA